ncbi:MAG TPA: TPM domain-containing protein [Tepidisphaeraceae bacterium]|jgi:uncharacterized membrane protein YgcG|nr:TPM domain-containing protein [Tepidisphaeraceae bacterium]
MLKADWKSREMTWALAIVAMLFLAGSRARAAEPEVRDDGHFFTPATLEHANGIIQQIKQKFGKDVTVETFGQIPDRMKPRLAAEEKEQFYENWLRKEARDNGTNGIFVLIVKDPGRLQVGVGNETVRGKVFTPADRDAMRDAMLARFRENQYDQGLLDGLNFAFGRIDENTHGGRRTVTPATQPAVNHDTGPATQEKTTGDKPATTPEPPVAPAAPATKDQKAPDAGAPDPAVKPDAGAEKNK